MSELSELFETLDAASAARRLLGCELVRSTSHGAARVRIVETEAYDQTDAASHSFSGRTPRTDVMFGPAGRLYVYFTYGMHYCCNVVTGAAGEGAAVLIRAVEPIDGTEILQEYRPKKGIELTNGPAKLCQALSINAALNGHDLSDEPIRLILRPMLADAVVVQTTRIGIAKSTDLPWRWFVHESQYVSKR